MANHSPSEPQRQDVSAERDAYVAQRQVVNVHHHYGSGDTPRRRLRVFVSWTSDDLHDHREQVHRALLRLGAEDIPAQSAQERLAAVRDCDLYVGLFAWRHDLLLEQEYRAAAEANVPRLIFLLSDKVPWPPGAMDRGAAGARIDALREELAAVGGCEYFTTPADLYALVTDAIHPLLRGDSDPQRTGSADATAWRAYRQRLVSEYGRLDLEALTPPEREEYLQLWLSEVFVEPNVREDAPPVELSKELWRKLRQASELSRFDIPDGLSREDLERARRVYRTRPARAAFDVLAGALGRLCVLLGDPGAGKSTIARYLALALAEDRTADLGELADHQPVLIELRDYALARPQCESFADYLAYRARTDGLGLPDGLLDAHLNRGGQALVIFDGLDELFDPVMREAVAQQIAWFASTHPTARVLVTSRIVGYRRHALDNAGFSHFTIQDLDSEQVKTFLTSWYGLALHDRPRLAEQRRERLTAAIEESPSIKELVGNPLLLTILAIIGKHRELPRERWKVYDHAASVLVEHWDVNKHLRDARLDADVIREDDKKDLLRRLAYRMQVGSEGRAGNHIWLEDLVAEIVDYLRERFQYDLARATAIANAMVEQFRERNFVLARYGPRVYGFVHRALLEFFCAGEVVTRFEKTRVLGEEELRHEVFGGHWEDPAWAEVLRLIAGMVDATVADRLVSHLAESVEPTRSTALDHPSLGATALAVQCLAEIRNIGAATSSARLVLQAITALLRRADRSFSDDRDELLESVILPAVTAVGSTWPGRELYLEWFQSHARRFVTWSACRFGPRLLAALYSDSEPIRLLLADLARHAPLPEQRQGCLLSMTDAWADRPDTLELASGLLGDSAVVVRQAAVEQLADRWTTHEGTLPAVHSALLDLGRDVRQAAVQQLALHWPADPGTLPAVHDALLDPVHDVREVAVQQLATRWATDPATLPALHRATMDPNWQVRRAAVQALDAPWARTPETFAVVHRAVTDLDEDVREAAVRALASRWADKSATLPTLLRAIRDHDPQVGAAAVEQVSLHWPDDPATLPALRHAARSLSGEVQCAALVAETRCPGGAADALPPLLDRVATSLEDDVRRAAVQEVGRRAPDSPVVFDALIRATTDPASEVRHAALEVLANHWPGRSQVKAVCLRSVRSFETSERNTALQTLARFWGGHRDVLPILLTGARDEQWTVRKSALEALSTRWSEDPEARTALVQATRDQLGLIRQTALEALAARSADTGPAFTALDDPHDGTRNTAYNILADRLHDPKDLIEALHSALAAERGAALITAVARHDDEPTTWTALDEALSDCDADIRDTALELLTARRRDHPGTLAKVLAATRDVDPDIRHNALVLMAVRASSHPDTRSAVERALRDLDGNVAQLALETLAVRTPDRPDSFPAVRDGCHHPSMTVRRVALQVLTARWLERPETFATVLECSYDPEDDAREEALRALWLCWANRDEVVERTVEATRDPSEDVRSQALKLLTRSRPEHSAISQLLTRARRDADPEVRQVALTAQGHLSGTGPGLETASLAQTVAATMDADMAVRRQALTRLLLKWPRLPETFRAVQFALHDGDFWVTVPALAGLLHRWPEDPRTQATAEAAVRAPHWLARHHAMLVLATTRPDDPATRKALAKGLRDSHWWVRNCAVQRIAQLWPDSDPSGVVDVLVRACRDEQATVRSTALARLATLFPDDPAALPTITGLARDANAVVRRAALERLLILRPGDPLTAAALHEDSRDPHASIRTLARQAMARRTPGRTRELREVIRDARHGHWADRASAFDELATRWPDAPETLTVLRRAAADDSGPLRQWAAKTLTQRWWDDPDVDALMQRMAADDDGGVRKVAINALSTKPDHPGSFAAITAATTDPYWAVCVAAMKRLVIRWSASDDVATLLRKATGDPDWYVRYIATSLLCGYASEGETSTSGCDPSEDVRLLLSDAPLPGADHDALTAACDDPDHTVHLPSLTALITWWPDHPRTREILTRATRNPCPGMRHLALSVLLPETDDGLMARAAIDDPAPEIRMLGLSALHRTGQLDQPTLARLLTDDHPDIVEQAIELCLLLDPPVLDADLFEHLRVAAENSPSPWPRAWIEWRGGHHAGP